MKTIESVISQYPKFASYVKYANMKTLIASKIAKAMFASYVKYANMKTKQIILFYSIIVC